MVGRKTQAQTIIDLIDKRLKSILGKGSDFIGNQSIAASAKSQCASSQAFEDVTFITRDENRGGGHGDLPNSRPVFDLDCDLVPDSDNYRRIGLSDKAWGIVYANRLDLKSENHWLKLTVDYFYENIGFKAHSDTIRLNGFGNHRVKDENGTVVYPNSATVLIKRPLPYSDEKPYTGTGAFRFDPWYSRWGFAGCSGIGSRKPCVSECSSRNPSVEAEIIDSGNPDCIFVRFVNFLPYPVSVGVAVSF